MFRVSAREVIITGFSLNLLTLTRRIEIFHHHTHIFVIISSHSALNRLFTSCSLRSFKGTFSTSGIIP
jgi:hypothetical protein